MKYLQPLIDKLSKPAILDSRAFQSGLVGMVVTCLIYYVPELEAYRDEMPNIIMVITVALIGRFTYSNGDTPEKPE